VIQITDNTAARKYSSISFPIRITNVMTNPATQTATTALIIGLAEQQIRNAERGQERQSHLDALAAMEQYKVNDPEGTLWHLDELTKILGEDLQQTIETSECPRSVVFSALLGLFVPYDGLEICTVHDESYASLEEILSAEQWLDHDGEEADEEPTT
jgi:hypothetical protein